MRVTLIAVLMIAFVGVIAIAPVANETARAAVERTLGSGALDSTRAQAPKWVRVDFTTTVTDTATFRQAWTGTADMRFEIRRASDDAILARNITAGTTSPKTTSAALTAGTPYYAAVWAFSGSGTYTLTIGENTAEPPPPPPPPTGGERTIATGTVDSTRAQAPKWVRTDFSANRTGTANLRLTWTTSADVRFEIRRASNAAIVASNTTAGTTAPKTASAALTAGTAYYAAVWAYSGRTTYTLTIDDGATPPPPPPPPPPGTRPNVVIINLDDMNLEALQYLPKINQWLVNAGTSFPNGYVSTPACCPSRATLMSGRYVHNNGQLHQNNQGLDVSRTLQRYLHDAGYFTGHAGKFLHWWPLGSVAPYWDRWTYFKGGYENIWIDFDGQVRQPGGYSTTIVFDRAIEYVTDFQQRDDTRPFFLELTPVAPHDPLTPEAKYANASVPPPVVTPSHTETDLSDKPPFVLARRASASTISTYRTQQIRMLYTVDEQVDRFMLALQQRGELDNTLVIFTSDNGYMWGEHQLRSKFLPYVPSVGVPFVIRWPGHVAAGAIDQRFVTHVDIVPTVLAATGVVQNLAPVDGKDVLSGHVRQLALSEYYFDTANANGIPTWAAVRSATYLYVEYYGESDATNTTPTYREYYDMVNDPYQLVNLYGDGNPNNDPNTAVLSAQLQSLKTCQATSCP